MRHFSCSMLCLVAILIGIPIHCIGQQQPQKTTEQTAVLALPWRAVGIWSAMPGILMVLNDGKPHLFVVDTGAVESQIDTVVAKRQNLPVKSVAPGKSTKQYIECPIN